MGAKIQGTFATKPRRTPDCSAGAPSVWRRGVLPLELEELGFGLGLTAQAEHDAASGHTATRGTVPQIAAGRQERQESAEAPAGSEGTAGSSLRAPHPFTTVRAGSARNRSRGPAAAAAVGGEARAAPTPPQPARSAAPPRLLLPQAELGRGLCSAVRPSTWPPCASPPTWTGSFWRRRRCLGAWRRRRRPASERRSCASPTPAEPRSCGRRRTGPGWSWCCSIPRQVPHRVAQRWRQFLAVYPPSQPPPPQTPLSPEGSKRPSLEKELPPPRCLLRGPSVFGGDDTTPGPQYLLRHQLRRSRLGSCFFLEIQYFYIEYKYSENFPQHRQLVSAVIEHVPINLP